MPGVLGETDSAGAFPRKAMRSNLWNLKARRSIIDVRIPGTRQQDTQRHRIGQCVSVMAIGTMMIIESVVRRNVEAASASYTW